MELAARDDVRRHMSALIDNDFANISAIVSNEYNASSAGLTDMTVAREENLREECGNQHMFSTAS